MVIERLTEPRIAPLPLAAWDPELRERFERPGGLGQILNVMKTLANHAGLFKRWVVFANHFLFKSTLSLRDREIIILRTGWLAAASTNGRSTSKSPLQTAALATPSSTPLPKAPGHCCGARQRRR